jgi:hypothetical protein
VRSLTFAYPGHEPLISDLTLSLPAGSRCLLCGANGGGAWPTSARVCVCVAAAAARLRTHSRCALTPPARAPARPQASPRCCRCWAARRWWTRTQCACSGCRRFTPRL